MCDKFLKDFKGDKYLIDFYLNDNYLNGKYIGINVYFFYDERLYDY